MVRVSPGQQMGPGRSRTGPHRYRASAGGIVGAFRPLRHRPEPLQLRLPSWRHHAALAPCPAGPCPCARDLPCRARRRRLLWRGLWRLPRRRVPPLAAHSFLSSDMKSLLSGSMSMSCLAQSPADGWTGRGAPERPVIRDCLPPGSFAPRRGHSRDAVHSNLRTPRSGRESRRRDRHCWWDSKNWSL